MTRAWAVSAAAVAGLRVEVCQPGEHAGFRDGSITDWRVLPYLVVAQAYEGRYALRLKDGTSAVCESGGAFIIAAEVPHHIVHHAGSSGRLCARWLHVRITLAGAIEASRLLRPPLVVGRAAFRPVEPLLLALLAKDRADNPLVAAARRTRLALEVFEHVAGWSEPAPDAAVVLSGVERLGGVLAYIQARLARPLPVAELAHIAELSLPRFHAVFKRTFGIPPREYMLRERLARARLLLAGGSSQVETVAATCGFPDAFHFSRLFRQRFGLSPSAWRQQQAWWMDR